MDSLGDIDEVVHRPTREFVESTNVWQFMREYDIADYDELVERTTTEVAGDPKARHRRRCRRTHPRRGDARRPPDRAVGARRDSLTSLAWAILPPQCRRRCSSPRAAETSIIDARSAHTDWFVCL